LKHGVDQARWVFNWVGRPYVRSAAVWGGIALVGLTFVISPYEVVTKIPLIGSYYIDEAREIKKEKKRLSDIEKAKKAREEASS